MTDSRNKGNRGEREFAGLLSAALGTQIARNLTQVRDGGTDILDVEGWAIEVRRRERLALNAWWREVCARRYAEPRHPALAYRRNRRPWRVMVPLSCLVAGAPGDEAATLSIEGFAALLQEPYRG